ncbi:MAG TPA: hypothetical protein VH724_11045, partial [Candidatus Angelobacter sp.]|nr:hypothetical protein [Candidatus Angelobacter sp.]
TAARQMQPDVNVTPPTPPPPMPSSGMAAAAAAVPAFAYPPLVVPAPPPEKIMSMAAKISIAIVGLLAVAFALAGPIPDLPNEAQVIGFKFGRLMAGILFPFIIAYPIAGRKKARNPNLFAGLFCGIGLFVLLANLAGSAGSLQPETTDQKLSRLMREAAGLQPVRKSLFGEPKIDAKMRVLFKDLVTVNKEYQQAVDKFDVSSTARLATPQSFADPDSVAGALQVLHSAYELDALQEQRMQKILDDFKHGFDDLSPSDREAMLNSFSAGLTQVMPARKRAISMEKAWIDAMDDVYGYAQAHHSVFNLVEGHLQIADNAVREEFNLRVRTLNARRTEFVQAKSAFDQMQGESYKRLGLSREQTGLHDKRATEPRAK